MNLHPCYSNETSVMRVIWLYVILVMAGIVVVATVITRKAEKDAAE